jgi:hypothetical protein
MSPSEPQSSGAESRENDSRSHQVESDTFEQLSRQKPPGLVREFFQFAVENKKWWLIPIIAVLALIAVMIFVSGTAGPFIYPLF